MTGGYSRRGFLGGVLSAVAGAAFAEAPVASLRPAARPEDILGGAAPRLASLVPPPAEELIAAARLGGHVGFVVADARTGVVLESRDGDRVLPPASVAKVLTALYALAVLGPDFRFATRFVATGPVVDGTLEGDLILQGGGDPLLDTDALAAMVAELKGAGVRAVRGRFLVHANALPYQPEIDPGQPDHVGYNPPVSGLNLNFNRVHFEWQAAQSGWTLALDARSDTLRPAVTVARMAVVERDQPVYTYRAAGEVDEWTVASTALGPAGSRWLPVRRPDLYAGEVAQVLAAAHGLKLPAPAAVSAMPDDGAVLARHLSPTLSTIVRLMLQYSTNLTAEAIGLAATARRGIVPTDLRASAAAMNDWAAATYGVTGLRFVDHSGLGAASEVSAEAMVRLLVRAGYGAALTAHLKEIAPLDGEGTPLASPSYEIRAKTGSLNFVSSLAGYVTSADGTPLAFAIFTGDVARRADLSPEEMERPDGARGWAGRSRRLQHQLLNRWAGLYGA